ncbi:hypothetical protein G9A89_002425 [Geosiphon pyriformis]|nr:hypothetical protein G9A89_002425 [Geosiphon pyriformis]
MLYYHNREIKEIEISTNGSLVKASSEDTKGAATFMTHRIKANFDIAVDKTLLSTKTETKAVLLALKIVLYKSVIRKKRIDLTINKVAAHTEISKNEKADKLAKEATALNTMEWTYNDKNTSYVPSCREIKLDLNIRHFLTQQTKLQAALKWISNNKVQEILRPLD